MIVCGLITKAAQSLPVGKLTRLLAMAVIMAVVSLSPLTLSLPCAMYYLAGHALRTSGQPFTLFFPSTLLAVLPFAALACFPSCLSKATPGGAVMVYLSVCSLLTVIQEYACGKYSLSLAAARCCSMCSHHYLPCRQKPWYPFFPSTPRGSCSLPFRSCLQCAGVWP